MNDKLAKQIRKQVRSFFNGASIRCENLSQKYGRVITKQFRNEDGEVVGIASRAVLDPQSPRALYQLTKQFVLGRAQLAASKRRFARGGRSPEVVTDIRGGIELLSRRIAGSVGSEQNRERSAQPRSATTLEQSEVNEPVRHASEASAGSSGGETA